MDADTALVTGGAGFIGSHLTERLLDNGLDVTVLDDLSNGSTDNLRDADDAEFVEGDVRDRSTVRDLVSDRDLVFHLAANAHVPTSVEDPRYDFSVNADGTQVVLEESVEAGVDRVVFASSAAVYGPPRETPIPETHPLDPVSPYGASKLAGEKLGKAYDATYDVEVAALRIFNTYGPRQNRYVMYDFLRKLERDPSRLELLGSGQERRSFVYVDDTVDAFLALATSDDAPGRAFNVGGNRPISILDLARLMADRYTDGDTEIVPTGEEKPGDVPELVTDNTRIESLGVTIDTPLDHGLDRLHDWYRENVAEDQ